MNQTWENDKKSNSGPDFGLLSQNLGSQIFFAGSTFPSDWTLFQPIILCSLKEN